MKRSKTPSFILELPLRSCPSVEKRLESRFESGRQLYNACLGEAMRRLRLMRQSKGWTSARKMEKGKARNEAFSAVKKAYCFTEYDLHAYVCLLRKNFNGIDIHTAQKLATRAFKAVERVCHGQAKKVRFKGYRGLSSVESKSNDAGIRFRENRLEWGKDISLKAIIDNSDPFIQHGLSKRIKFSRIYRRKIRGKIKYSIQLILEGKPLILKKNSIGEGIVGMDFGPSTLAVVAASADGKVKSARLLQFCKELEKPVGEIRREQRKLDRQRRANNPENYLPNGSIRKGKKTWKKSNRQKQTEDILAERERRMAAHRKSLHGQLSNEVLKMGNIFKVEAISGKWLQKSYGKSIGARAPKLFEGMMDRKAVSAGGSFIKFPTVTTKLSQTCVCGQVKKKDLSEMVHACGCGVRSQRDLFSGFLAIFVEGNKENQRLQVSHATKAWPGADKLLRMAWDKAEYAIGGIRPSSFGGVSRRSQSISSGKGRIAKGEAIDVVAACSESHGEPKVFPSKAKFLRSAAARR